MLIERIVPFGSEIEILPFFSIVHVRNFGGVFGLLNNTKIGKDLFTYLPMIVSLFILFYLFKEKNSFRLISLSLIFGGAIGNLFDRLRSGFVVDFFDFHIKDFHWPAFNLADSAISLGVILFCYNVIFKERKKDGR